MRGLLAGQPCGGRVDIGSRAEGQGVGPVSQDGLLITITQRASREPWGVRRQAVSPSWKTCPSARQVQGGSGGCGPGSVKRLCAHAGPTAGAARTATAIPRIEHDKDRMLPV